VTGADTLTFAPGTTLTLSGAIDLARQTANPTATESPALTKANKIILPKVQLREVTVAETLEWLSKLAMEADPDKTGVKIMLKPGTTSDARITLALTDVPLVEALKYVVSLANLEFVPTPDAIVVQPTGASR
jgi:hypothetical protein